MNIPISSTRIFNELHIDNNLIDRIKNSNDKDNINNFIEKLFLKIKDFFCGSNVEEAEYLLFDIFHNKNIEKKYDDFLKLKELVSPACKDKFLCTIDSNGNINFQVNEDNLFEVEIKKIDNDFSKKIFNNENISNKVKIEIAKEKSDVLKNFFCFFNDFDLEKLVDNETKKYGKIPGDAFIALFEFEANLFNKINEKQNILIKEKFEDEKYNEILTDEKFNKENYTNNIDRAVAWIMNASNSKLENDFNQIKEIILKNIDSDLTNFNIISEINKNFNKKENRGIFPGEKIPSSFSGKILTEIMLKKLSKSDENIGKKLFGIVVGCHGFSDGNGRTGRILFAINELKNKRFNPMSFSTENHIHNLNK
jgi:hypothetical protein